MANLSVSGICRLTRDAEVKKSSMGTWYSFGVAAYRKNVKEGKQSVDFFDADVFQKEPPAGYERVLSKGRLIYIENAYLRNDQFTGTDGSPKSRVKLQITMYEPLGDGIGVRSDVPEPPKYEKKQPSAMTASAQTIGGSIHPSDLPPPSNSSSYTKKVTIDGIGTQVHVTTAKLTELPTDMGPEFPDDEEPPF